MEQNRAYYLINGYLNNQLTPLETEELQQLLLEEETAPQINASFQDIINSQPADDQYVSAQWEHIADNILLAGSVETRIHKLSNSRTKIIRRWMAVAAAFIVICAGTYRWVKLNRHAGNVAARQTFLNVAPGRDGAVLTLADGSQMVLDSLGNTVVAHQQGTDVILNNGRLSYAASDATADQVVFNTLSTPKGRQFHVTLADGTGVWLNAASSLRFPTAFNGKERVVEVTGEAYFDVAENHTKPFKVALKDGAEINILGTQFNVNAYDDEPEYKITLLQGAVNVKKGTLINRLNPGQQARITTSMSVTDGVDVDRVIAWKNGTFSFGKEVSLQEMMRQIARWYDIEIKYEGVIPQRQFGGKIHRAADINKVLEVLEEIGIRYRVNNKQLIILP